MSGRPGPPRHVPTLTEVVEPSAPRTGAPAPERIPPEALRRPAENSTAMPLAAAPVPSGTGAGLTPAGADDEAALQRLAAELERRVEAAVAERLERRVQEVLAPTLARITEALVLETREQLAAVLSELLAEAVRDAEGARRGRMPPR